LGIDTTNKQNLKVAANQTDLTPSKSVTKSSQGIIYIYIYINSKCDIHVKTIGDFTSTPVLCV